MARLLAASELGAFPFVNNGAVRAEPPKEVKPPGASPAAEPVPDGDRLSFRWFVYRQAGTYARDVPLSDVTATTTALTVPADAAGKTVHVVLEVTDGGEPALTRYRRVVIRISR
jgi:hypothetical protein